MGSPLGLLMANTFMCSLEEQLKLRDKLSSYYKRYVDDTALTVMKDDVSAYSFLHVLNGLHPSLSFTMELPTENTLSFLGMVTRKESQIITTSVCVKPTNTGLLLHYNIHVDNRYKKSQVYTRLDRAFKLSSNSSLFHEGCIRLKTLSLQLAYSEHIFHSMIQQSEGVAMGSPLDPLMANTFMCSLEEQLKLRDKLTSYYKRLVDDTLTVMKHEVSAYSFLHVLNELHPSISFTMELPTENTLSFLGLVLRIDSQNITTSVHACETDQYWSIVTLR